MTDRTTAPNSGLAEVAVQCFVETCVQGSIFVVKIATCHKPCSLCSSLKDIPYMENKIVKYFSQITTLSKEEEKALADGMVVTNLKKDTFLIKEGQTSIDTYFILEGCLRQYCLIDGEEKTTNFFTEGQWVISLTGLTQNTPSYFNLVCMEDTSLVIGNEQMAQQLFKKFPRFETLARVVVEKSFAEQQRLMTSYHTDTPEQRYLKLLKSRPDLFQRVSQYHMASYIGVKPESLSRIRKRITKNSL
jgi:CRP-like cAMP-binding protein